MTTLRQRMISGYAAEESLAPYPGLLRATSLVVRTPSPSTPDALGPEEIRAYQLHLTNERKLATGSILIAVAALGFLYKVTLHKAWTFEDLIPAPKKPQRLPIVLSPKEVLQFLGCVSSLKHRTILTACYAAGLRISEGQKDRYVMLSPRLLAILRDWWRVANPKGWSTPSGPSPAPSRWQDYVGRYTHRGAISKLFAAMQALRRPHRRARKRPPFTSQGRHAPQLWPFQRLAPTGGGYQSP